MSLKKLRNSQITVEASEWAVKLDANNLTQQEKKDLAGWLVESPRHVDELLLSASLLTGLSYVDKDIPLEIITKDFPPDILPLLGYRNPISILKKTKSFHYKYISTIAAVFILTIMLSLGIFFSGNDAQNQIAFITETGEQRSLTLADGTIIHVNTETDINITYKETERVIHLAKGEAMFEVAPDPSRPFRVYTKNSLTQAVGTIFNIRSTSDITKVAVLEGKVTIGSNQKQNKNLSAPIETKRHLIEVSKQASITNNGTVTTLTDPNIQDISAWRMRKLIFKSDTLSYIASEFNRYNHEKIYIDDTTIAKLQFSGVLNADDPHSFILYLETTAAIKINRSHHNQFHLTK